MGPPVNFSWGISSLAGMCKVDSHSSLEFLWGHWESSQVASGGLGLVSSCVLELRVPLELLQGSRASSQIVAGNSGFLSSCSGKLRVPLELKYWFGAPLELRVGM